MKNQLSEAARKKLLMKMAANYPKVVPVIMENRKKQDAS